MPWVALSVLCKCGRTKMRDTAYSYMHPICPGCDRIACGQCKKIELSGRATLCDFCRIPMGIHRDQR